MIPVSRGSGNVISRTALFLVFAVAAGAAIVKADKGARMSAAGRACSSSLGQGGHHAIDQFRSHRHPEAWIEPAPGQANHLASAAGHHAETQHYRPAGARTGLAAPRRPPLVVQKICRIAGAVDANDRAGTNGRANSGFCSPNERSDIRGRCQMDVTLPHVAPLMRATHRVTSPSRPFPPSAAPRGPA